MVTGSRSLSGKISHIWLSKPTNTKLIDAWEEAHAQIVTWLQNCMEPKVLMLRAFGIPCWNVFFCQKHFSYLWTLSKSILLPTKQ